MNKKLLYTYIAVFLVMSLFLGKVLNFYHIIPHWDKILHAFSGFILYPWGVFLYLKLNGEGNNRLLKVALALLFSISCALLWEVWEFTGDRLFGLNSQNNSLKDTMLDMIMGCMGAVISVFCHNKKSGEN